MQNLLGKMADLMSSLLPRSPPSVPASNSGKQDDMKLLVVDFRTLLTTAIYQGKDCTEVIKRLTELDCQLCDKYAILQVTDLLRSNNKSLEELKHITSALAVIVKYAQHLIKKPELRREQWRIIQFSNSVVSKKITPMKGFQVVLQQLGYTISTPYGLRYPNQVEPDVMVIINLIADMILFRKEIKEYILGRHLYPQYLQLYIPIETQHEVQVAQMSGLRCEDEDFNEATAQISFISPEGQLGDQSDVFSGASSDTQMMTQSSRTPEECNNNSVNIDKIPAVIPDTNKTLDISVSSNVDVPVAYESPAVNKIKEPECETEKLQSSDNQVQAIQDLVTPNNELDNIIVENISGMSSCPRLACTVCGDEAVVYCEDCTKKTLCHACNTNWHKHPQRQGHVQNCITVLDFASAESINLVHIDGAYGISAQTNTNAARMNQKQQTHQVKQKALNKATPADQKLYSSETQKLFPDSPETQAQAFYLPNQIQTEPTQLTDYQRLENMNLQHHHYQQPLHYSQSLSASGYQSQVPYSNARLVYPGSGYLQSQINSGHHGRSDMDSFSPISSQKQLFNNSEIMNNYHPEIGVQHQHTLPYLQQQLSDPQRQVPVLHSQQSPGWHYQGMPNRTHNPYQYSQDMAHSQHMEDFGAASYAPNSIMLNSMFSHANPNSVSTNQMFSVNQQRVLNSNIGQYSRGNQLLHHQGTLLPGNANAQMNMQSAYNPSRGHNFHPTTLDIHQMNMPGLFGGNQNSVNSPSQYQIMPMTKPYQIVSQPMTSSMTSSLYSLSSILKQIFEQLHQLPSIELKCSKCDEHIATLVNEIAVLEQQINSAMEADIEVCETDQFKTCNKQKAFLMQQKKWLEEYKQQLEDETVLMKMNSDEEVQQKIHYPPDIDLSSKGDKKHLNVPVTRSERVPNTTTENATFSNVSELSATISNTNNSFAVTTSSTTKIKTSQSTKMAGDKLINTASSGSQVAKVQNTPPPVPQRLPKVDKDNLKADNILNRTFPPPKFDPASDTKNWHCQHCTFINPAGAHVCAICNNPLLVGLSHVDSNDDDDVNCNETQEHSIRPDILLDMLEEKKGLAQAEKQHEDMKFVQNDDDDTEDKQTNTIGNRIRGSQEQVMKEKKKAQQEYIQHQREQQMTARKKSPTEQPAPAPRKSKSPSPIPSPRKSNDSEQRLQLSGSHSPGPSGYHTPPSSASPSPYQITNSHQHKIVHHELKSDIMPVSLGSYDNTLEDTIARFNEVSMIDSMQVQGAEFIKLIKLADKEGFDVEALQIAQSFSDVQNMGPVEWLKQYWKKNVNMVAAMAVTAGNSQQQNTVGEVSIEEAESAYISCHGNMKDAAHMCVSKRTELYDYLGNLGDYPREEILQVMFQCCGDREAAEKLLIESTLRPFLENIWAEKETDTRNRFAFDLPGPMPEMCHSFSTSIIFHGDFQKMIKDKNLNLERRIRMIFVEGKLRSWGRAELVIKILDNDLPGEDISLEDVVEAVRNCQDRNSALAYLQQECALCFTNFPMSKIRNLNICQCKICEQCLTKNFEIGIREKHVRHWTCPLCSLPDMNDADVASDYLHFLLLLLQPLIAKDLQNLFETKVRDWHLQKDVSFRWCAHCAEGFLAENQGGHLRMTCPHCQEKTCFQCKKQWEPQHEGLTCEEFSQWKIDNDPTNQSVGLAKHLDENGIDCPTCKMRFALAKGGCMHFKCPQCGHEFCSGCNEPFHHKDVCVKYKICKKLGLHCHCPRDCFSYLRDRPVQELHQLLKMHEVHFNISTPEDQPDPLHCPVMEQKEFDAGKKDEKCGKETLKGQAGLCEIHYKEYLVYIINRHELDPVVLMTKEEMVNLLLKYDIYAPKQSPKETPEDYLVHLIKVIQEELPLRR